MVKWECPWCKEDMYSAWDSRDRKTVICVNCGKEIENPYYKGNKRKL